jgi:hypothetical protein
VPAEGIHLSALIDAAAVADGEAARLLRVHDAEARLGALLVDLPYFERFPVELVRYVARRPPRPSPWGDLLHRAAPARVGLALVRGARDARRPAWIALALGYLSHVAVDSALHPLVNRLARARAAATGASEGAQHREVEKFQSVLFHERRMGVDLMGTRALERYIAIAGARLLSDGELVAFVDGALRAAIGQAPARGAWRAWATGYAQYTRVLGSPLGRLPAPPAAKARERAALYVEPAFEREYTRAVERARGYVAAGLSAVERDDEGAFFAAVPEGSIDDPPY